MSCGWAAIHADNRFAVDAVLCRCRLVTNTRLVHAARGLWLSCPVPALAGHVPAHRGIPANELADALAELGRRGGRLGQDCDVVSVVCHPAAADERDDASVAFWQQVLANPDPLEEAQAGREQQPAASLKIRAS